VLLAIMVSEPASPLLAIGSGGRVTIIFLFWLLTLARGRTTIFSKETYFPRILEPVKQHLKNHKNMNNSYLDI
jgi:hypothetical protein